VFKLFVRRMTRRGYADLQAAGDTVKALPEGEGRDAAILQNDEHYVTTLIPKWEGANLSNFYKACNDGRTYSGGIIEEMKADPRKCMPYQPRRLLHLWREGLGRDDPAQSPGAHDPDRRPRARGPRRPKKRLRRFCRLIHRPGAPRTCTECKEGQQERIRKGCFFEEGCPWRTEDPKVIAAYFWCMESLSSHAERVKNPGAAAVPGVDTSEERRRYYVNLKVHRHLLQADRVRKRLWRPALEWCSMVAHSINTAADVWDRKLTDDARVTAAFLEHWRKGGG
jgi:hypothetical protein